MVRFLNPDLEDLGSQGPGSLQIVDRGSRIRDRRPLAEQKTTSEQVWVPMGGAVTPKCQPHIFNEVPSEILDGTLAVGFRQRSEIVCEINKNERPRTLRFSLWKPSPFLALVLMSSAYGFRISEYGTLII